MNVVSMTNISPAHTVYGSCHGIFIRLIRQQAADVAPEVLCRLLDGIDTTGFISTLLVPHQVSCANRQFGCNKKARLLGEQRRMPLYYDTVYMKGWSALVENQLSISLFGRWIRFYTKVNEKVSIWEMVCLTIKRWQNQTIVTESEITSSVKVHIHSCLNYNRAVINKSFFCASSHPYECEVWLA